MFRHLGGAEAKARRREQWEILDYLDEADVKFYEIIE